jgi:hypothetical protein
MPPFTDGNFEETKWYPVRTKAICSLLTSRENVAQKRETQDSRRIDFQGNGGEELFERERGSCD